MSKLIEKKSYASMLVDLRILSQKDDPYKAILEYIDEQIQLAYIAGVIQFNAVTHQTKRGPWALLQEEFPVTGELSTLPSLYSQSKGFRL